MKEGDKGTELIFQIKNKDGDIVDLTTAQAAKLYYKLNNGTVVSKDMIFTDRPNGKVKYVVEDGVLSAWGSMRMEVEVSWDANNVFRTDVVIEDIKEKLD